MNGEGLPIRQYQIACSIFLARIFSSWWQAIQKWFDLFLCLIGYDVVIRLIGRKKVGWKLSKSLPYILYWKCDYIQHFSFQCWFLLWILILPSSIDSSCQYWIIKYWFLFPTPLSYRFIFQVLIPCDSDSLFNINNNSLLNKFLTPDFQKRSE